MHMFILISALLGVTFSGTIPRALSSTVCVHNNKTYYPGETFHQSPCEYCSCSSDGSSACAQIYCPYATCVDGVRAPGECCSSCPNGENCFLPNGNKADIIVKVGEPYNVDANTTCTCPSHTNGGTRLAMCITKSPGVIG